MFDFFKTFSALSLKKVGTASSYYLPLDRAKRAVDLIKRGEPVSRGTLQVLY
jgi:hypothetical protein